MNNQNNKQGKTKNSNRPPKVRPLSNVRKLYNQAVTTGLSVTYVFESNRIKFENKDSMGTPYKVVSKQIIPISPAMFRGLKGIFRTEDELKSIFKGTANDLGATYFVIN